MKKLLIIVFSVLAVMISLSACGGKKKAADVKSDASDSKTSATTVYDSKKTGK